MSPLFVVLTPLEYQSSTEHFHPLYLTQDGEEPTQERLFDSVASRVWNGLLSMVDKKNMIELGYRNSFQVRNYIEVDGFPDQYISAYREGFDYSFINTSYSTLDLTLRRGNRHSWGVSVGGFMSDDKGFYQTEFFSQFSQVGYQDLHIDSSVLLMPTYFQRESNFGLHLALPLLIAVPSSENSRTLIEFALHGFQMAPFVVTDNIEYSALLDFSIYDPDESELCRSYALGGECVEKDIFFLPLVSLGLGKELDVKNYSFSAFIETSGIPTVFANVGAHIKVSRQKVKNEQ